MLLFGLGQVSLATILEVRQDYPTIQAAMNATQPGDTVLVPPGTYHELMIAPTHELHLLSRYAFTQDSADIVNTVLDGELQGTILTLPAGEYLFDLNGFTVTRGLGSGEYPYPGGGIWAQAGIQLKLVNLVFIRNDTNGLSGLGSSVSAHHSNPIASLDARNLHFESNNSEQHQESSRGTGSFFISCEGVVTLRNIVCDGAGHNDAAVYLYTLDSLYVDSIRVQNFLNTECGAVVFRSETNAKVSNIVLRNNRSAGIGLFGVSAGYLTQGELELSNLIIEQNSDSFLVADMDISRAFVQLSASFIHAKDVTVRNNRQLVGYSLSMRADVEGRVRNLHVHDNVAGSDSTVQDNNMGRHLWLENLSLEDAEFWHNTSLMPAGGDGLGWTDSPLVYGYYGTSEEADTLVWENCRFRNNVVVNHMPQATLRRGLKGRTVFLRGLYRGNLVIRNCEWVNNRVSRIAPEVDLWPGPRNVGSTVELQGEGSISDGMNVVIEDCVFADNDDGGVFASNVGNGLIQRCQFERISRYGVFMYSNRDETSVVMKNVFFRDVLMDEYSLPQPRHQGVFWVHAWDGSALVQNVSIVSCSTSFLISLGNEGSGRPYVANSCFFDNWFDQFVIDEASVQDSLFSYCLVPFEIPGEGNLIGEPTFDSQLGAPYLDPVSLGIDQGHSDAAFNDVENPSAPGWAMWPSQGGLRNDIGFTGGPHAVVLDTTWVGVEPATPHPDEAAFVLGEPYPNPFNPVVVLPLTLREATELKIGVYNLLGQEVWSVADQHFARGEHLLRLDGSRLASGLYLVQVFSKRDSSIRKIVLLR